MGHILTKFELQVLSGLLETYSNEKIKEIQRSIQKKQGGDISREEVERSLRENGQAIVADELEENLRKGEYNTALIGKPPHINRVKYRFLAARYNRTRYNRDPATSHTSSGMSVKPTPMPTCATNIKS